jgi:hypothetical protein
MNDIEMGRLLLDLTGRVFEILNITCASSALFSMQCLVGAYDDSCHALSRTTTNAMR